MSNPTLAVFGAFIVIGTMALVVGALYLAGGRDAVRRQAPRLAVLAAGLVVVVLAVPILSGLFGDLAWGGVLLGLNVAVVGVWVYQSRRGEGPLVVEPQRAALNMPAFRVIAIIWVGALVIATILLVLAAKAG